MTQKKLHGLAEILDMDLYMLCEMVSGIFVPKTIRSLEHSFPGPFVPWNFRSRYPGPFLPQTIRSFVSRAVSGPLTKKNSVTNWSVMTAAVHSRCTQTVDLHFIFQSRPSFFCFKTFTLRTLLSVFAFRTLTLHTQLTFYCYDCTFYFIMFVTWAYVFAFTNIVYA